jgi:outer membrane scaffolding protein for murein synthesis (MipA/OmpV family)
MVMMSIGSTWADAKHMESYFGVSPAQSVRSGYSRYEAESGFKSVGISVGAVYNISENWDVMLMVNADQLLGDAADSPITKEDFSVSTFSTVNYKFSF